MESILIFLFSLGILIFFHELGHFLIAKKLKVPVEEFAIGFPPSLLRKKIGETIYSFNLIFLGGYVRLRGENNLNDPDGFLNKPAWIKIAIVLGGVFFNLILAYFLISFGYLIGLPEYSPQSQNVVILRIMPQGIAEKASLRMLDRLVYLKFDKDMIYFTDPTKVREIFENYRGKEVILGIERAKKMIEIKVTPEINKNLSPLGVYLGSLDLIKYKFPSNFYFGLIKTKDLFVNMIIGMKDFFIKLFEGKKEVLSEVVGPLGMFDIYNQFRLLGFNYLIYFLAIVSVNLVILNLLPIPALDGGRFIFYLYELLSGKKLPLRIENLVNTIGFIFLLILMILITIKDLSYKFFK
ncbi:MAG: zinc metalloprotease [Candidatus Parcubacteria bacterium]|nr:MAG: zinc metalloprotease [Candidatus Parcubacteria bacterium]